MRVPNVWRSLWRLWVLVERRGLEHLAISAQIRGLAERPAGDRIGEYEAVDLGLHERPVEPVGLAGEAVGHRDAATAPTGLRRVELAEHPVLPDADATSGPVDVAPAQGDQFAMAQARHDGGQVEGPVDRAVRAGLDVAQHCFALGLVEEPDLLVLRDARQFDGVARVRRGPASLRSLGVVE